jgi:hypothetical protein
VVCALLLVAAVLLRSVGFTLVVAAVAHLMLEGRHAVSMRLRKAVLIGVVCSISWLGVNYSTLGQIPYVSEFREGAAGEQADGGAPLGERVRTNLSGYREAAPEVVIYHLYRRPRPLLASLLIAVTGLGLAAAVIRRRTVIEYYAVTYGLLLLLYPPSNTGNLRRYLVPIIPFVLYYFVLGVRLAAGTLRHALHRFGLEPITARRALDWGRRVTFGAIVLLALANLVETTRASVLDDVPEIFDYSMYGDFEGYRAMATWAKTHTPTDSVVAVEEVYDFAFWSHRHVDWYPALPSGADERTTVARFLEADVSYVAVDGLDESPGSQSQLVRDALARSPDFVVVYRKRDNVLYRVVG